MEVKGCIVCGEELTVEDWKWYNGIAGPVDPWCQPCYEEENQRMVDEELIGPAHYRTLPRYLVPHEEWEE